MLGDIPEGLHQSLGIVAGEPEQREKPSLSAVVWVGFVEKIVENLAAVDHGEVSVAKLHVNRLVLQP